ncbi:hypothetical protein D3C78_19640 [compost metagenome]
MRILVYPSLITQIADDPEFHAYNSVVTYLYNMHIVETGQRPIAISENTAVRSITYFFEADEWYLLLPVRMALAEDIYSLDEVRMRLGYQCQVEDKNNDYLIARIR